MSDLQPTDLSVKSRAVPRDSVFVAQSPSTSIQARGNTTGTVRIIRDNVASVVNLINRWNDLVKRGYVFVQELVKMFFDEFIRTHGHPENAFTPERQVLFLKLEPIVKELAAIMDNLNSINENIVAISNYEHFHERTAPLFISWPIDQFVSVFQKLTFMYSEELEGKQKIQRCLGTVRDRALMSLFRAAWIQQPFLDGSVNAEFEAMLVETGLK